MKKYSILMLAVLVLSLLVTQSSSAQSNFSLTIGGKQVLELTEVERSNAIYVLQHPTTLVTSHSNLTEQAKSVIAEVAQSTKQNVATNINQVMVEILSGVKNAGGEMYKFSKQEIGQAYDMMKKEVPKVVTEFLMWQVAKAGVWIFIGVFVACLLFFFARKLNQYAEKDGYYSSDAIGFKWILRVIACILLVVTLEVQGMTIAKICVAPRVYIIEYVMDVAQGNAQQYR